MGLGTLSPMTMLSLWSELEQAYYGDNKFGGHTAEIYAYRLMRYNPSYSFGANDPTFQKYERERQDEARDALYDLCCLFETKRNAIVTIDGLSLVAWKDMAIFDHRAHIRVEAR